jgi:hypothetical protein
VLALLIVAGVLGYTAMRAEEEVIMQRHHDRMAAGGAGAVG